MVNSRTTRPDGPQDQPASTTVQHAQSPRVPDSQVGSRSSAHAGLCLWAAPRRCSVMRRWTREPDGATSHALLCPGAPWDGDNGCPFRRLIRPRSEVQQHGGVVGRTEGVGLELGGQRCIRQSRTGQPGKRLGLGLIEQRGLGTSQAHSRRVPAANRRIHSEPSCLGGRAWDAGI